ncbi:AI-2E family transporter [Paenibacillus thiaminolyticus]|uniref:AI-2E family transporter n=1 Tax=Paenibacillus thiaminolyticus TaxID=49283 RepID=UPI00116462DC|nr:AI-2E family transporter [Paenibacillus thiaminolyticus]NGP60340.1 AI-2E family transporter [Paenibacillus thiaminolyticus]WCR26017.1 AI-2E family transporter [Paenibacillus thiaminolyticus]
MFKDRKTLYYLGLFTAGLLLYKLVDNIGGVLHFFSTLMSLMTPFFIAFFIAYLLRPLVNALEAKLFSRQRLRRLYSILIVYTLFLGLIFIVITVITPRIIESVSTLLAGLPQYIAGTEQWIRGHVLEQEWFAQSGIDARVGEFLSSASSQISEFVRLILNNLLSGLLSITTTLLNLVIGFIVSIYLLKDKEAISRGTQKILVALLGQNRAASIVDFVKRIDTTFSQYFVGVILDAMIIGSIVFVGLLILQSPFALLAALVVGVTNVIPYFGPFIGMLFVGLITLFVSPMQALWNVLFIFIIQQLDGYYIGPKVIGNKVGIGPLWIIFAIIIGGGFFGLIGMFIAVPVVAVIKTAFDSYIERRLSSK